MTKNKKNNNWQIFKSDNTPITWCGFCGAKVGDISDSTDKQTVAMYYCEKCWKNYCDQCSYHEKTESIRYCLRCDTKLELLFE